MADNIFDAQKDRRIAVLQQQSVSNVVRSNPNLRGVLTRYEDAEVSRLNLLQLQQMRSKKITAGEKALLKTLRKGRRATGGKGGKQKKEKTQAVAQQGEPEKSQTQIEVDAEEKREKLRLEKLKQRQDEDFRRDRLQIEDRQEIDRLNEQRDIARQGRLETARLAGADRGQKQQQFEAKQRQQLAIEDRKVRDIQERVARDDAFRHRQLEETQRLALEQLAAQQRDNERAHREQQNRIDNQRIVDADRAVSDREIIGGLQGRIVQLERQQFPSGQGLVEDIGSQSSIDLSSGSGAAGSGSLTESQAAQADAFFLQEVYSGSSIDPSVEGSPPGSRSPEPEPQPAPTLSSQPITSKPSKQRQIGLQSQRSQSAPVTTSVKIQEATTSGRVVTPPKRFTGGASEAELDAELASVSSLQSVDSAPARNLRSSTPPRQSTTLRSNTPPRATRSQSPEVFIPKVKTLAQVRRENPVGGED